MLSFWEKSYFISYDYVIVGSGISGLSAAITLAENDPGSSILVLERGIFPSGASTKNAGFASFGSVSELAFDIETAGEDATVALVEKRWKGLQKLRKRLGDETIGLEIQGGYELIFSKDAHQLHNIKKINLLLKDLFPKGAFFEDDVNKIKEFGFAKARHLIYTPYEATIITGKMMKALLKLAREKGITIITGAEVTTFEEGNELVKLRVKNTVHDDEIVFNCRKCLFCTNAFTSSFFPNLEIIPGRGQVVITKPLANLKFNGAFHYDEGYFYFRNVGNRVLLGGGRQHDFKTEQSTEFENTAKILEILTSQLKEIILPGQEFEIEHSWAGIMAFGPVKKPVVKLVSPNIAVAARLSGIGVAIGSLVGEEAASLLLS